MNTEQIDKVICECLSTCSSHMGYQHHLNFHLAINRLTPVEAHPAVLKVLTDFRVKNANKPTTYEVAEAEILKDMKSNLNFPRGVASIKRAVTCAGGIISDNQLAVLNELSPDSDYAGFVPQTLKEQWEQAVIQADNADIRAWDAICLNFKDAADNFTNKLYQFEQLERDTSLDNAYLKKKGLGKISGNAFCSGERVIVPLRSAFNTDLKGYQTIKPDGSKRFLKGVPAKSLFYAIGNIEEAEIIYLVEGFATAETIYQVTGTPTIAVMSSGNFLPALAGLSYWGSKALLLGDSGT